MAARRMQRQILSFITSSQPPSSLRYEFPRCYFPSSTSYLSRAERRIQTVSEPNQQAIEDKERQEASSVVVTGPSSNERSNNNNMTYNALSNLKTSSRHDLAMIFTCKVCETRSVKTACRESYEKGVVVARCGGCNNLHLIADRLGWFGEPGSVEDLLAARGEEVKKGSADTLNLTLEDLAGRN